MKKTVKNKKKVATTKTKALFKLDLGCGRNKAEGFYGVDIDKYEDVDLVFDLRKPWPWKDNSVEEINCTYLIEYFDQMERCHFVNETYRVLIPDGKMKLISRHWASHLAYGDPFYKWPPMAESWFRHLVKANRDAESPWTNKVLKCNFDVTWAYSPHEMLVTRNTEFQSFAISFYKETVQAFLATLTAKK